MKIGDRLIVLASERRGVMVGVAANGDLEVLLDGEQSLHVYSPFEVDVCWAAV
jgi:hypothetical protein